MIAVSPFSSDISAKQAKCRFTIEWVQNVNGGVGICSISVEFRNDAQSDKYSECDFSRETAQRECLSVYL